MISKAGAVSRLDLIGYHRGSPLMPQWGNDHIQSHTNGGCCQARRCPASWSVLPTDTLTDSEESRRRHCGPRYPSHGIPTTYGAPSRRGWAGCLAHVFPFIGRNTPVRLHAQRKRDTQIQFERVALRFPLMRKFDDRMQLVPHHGLPAPAGSRILRPPAPDLPFNGALLASTG